MLSRQIQLLERILDVTLLERTSRNVALTPAGRVFLIEARRIDLAGDDSKAVAAIGAIRLYRDNLGDFKSTTG